jgi:hypothetical protein
MLLRQRSRVSMYENELLIERHLFYEQIGPLIG